MNKIPLLRIPKNRLERKYREIIRLAKKIEIERENIRALWDKTDEYIDEYIETIKKASP